MARILAVAVAALVASCGGTADLPMSAGAPLDDVSPALPPSDVSPAPGTLPAPDVPDPLGDFESGMDLVSTGFNPEQAAFLINVVRTGTRDLATRAELYVGRSEVRGYMAALRSSVALMEARLQGDFNSQINRLLMWLIGLHVATFGAAFAANWWRRG